MAYNLKLAERIRDELTGIPFVEKKMFGVDPAKHASLLKKPHARLFDITGKPMKGWLIVEPEGCKTAKQLTAWVKAGADFASTFPPK